MIGWGIKEIADDGMIDLELIAAQDVQFERQQSFEHTK